MKKLILLLLTACSSPAAPVEVVNPEIPAHSLEAKANECPAFKFVVDGGKGHSTPVDLHIIFRAIERCAELYPNSPCVKQITKYPKKNHYDVICAGRQK